MPISNKKKIIIVGPAYPYRGGNSLYVSYVFDSLKEYFDVKIYNYKLLYPSLLFPGTTQFDKSNSVMKEAPNERVLNSINPFNWIKVANKLKQENADLIVFDWWHPFFGPCHSVISRLIQKKYKNKILFITENFISHEGNFVDKTLTKIGLKYASSFLALSDIVEKMLSEIAHGRTVYRSELPVFDCYNLSDTFSPVYFGFNSNNKILLFFGYIRKYKGLDLLIEAFPKILEHYPEARLLIVGEFYDDPSPYINRIKELKIENEVKLINKFIPNEEVGKYYSVSDLVILPYKSATQSGILNIAYAFNKPVLVTDVGGLAKLVEESKTGIIIQPDSPDQIVQGVLKFYNLQKTEDFSKNIESFVRSNAFSKLPELFNKIISDSKS
jgi:glycosyltransferase involved in cell wall biosynthesis